MVGEKRIARTLVVGIAACSLAACGSSASDSAGEVGDPGYVFDSVRMLRESEVVDAVEPQSLAEALPNHTSRATTDKGVVVEAEFSDAVATGRVSEVAPGEGIVYPNDPADPTKNDEYAEVVGYEDPAADERNVVVTMELDEVSGDDLPADVLTFRMGVPVDSDPEQFLAGLRELDAIAVVLKRKEDGRHSGELVPIMGGALLGEVTSGGSLSFPGLGDEEQAFMVDIDTTDELIKAARSPRTVTELG